MPAVNIKTNIALSNEQIESIKSGLGKAITAIPGKSENWLMVSFEPESPLFFKGNGDSPNAFVDVKLFGNVGKAPLSDFTNKVSNLLGENANIPASNIYVAYTQTPDWGWNGSNF